MSIRVGLDEYRVEGVHGYFDYEHQQLNRLLYPFESI